MKLPALALTFCLLTLTACIPGRDDGGTVEYSGKEGSDSLEDRSQDWFENKKVDRLPYDPIPPMQQSGALPRHLGRYHLDGQAPEEGKPFRNEREAWYIEEKTKNRRIRVFSQHDVINRIQALTRLTELPTSNPEELFELIENVYGEPDLDIEPETIFVDEQTLLLFKIGGEFLITDMFDIDSVEMPDYIREQLSEVK